MSSFPLSVEMRSATVFLVGGDPAAEEKLRKLLLFEATICVFAPTTFVCAEHPQVKVVHRALREADLEQRPLFVVSAAGEAENRRISHLCRKRHIPFNAVDMPQLCTFTFPALIKRGGVTISISTGGENPALASVLRKKIENCLPEDLEDILDQLSALRRQLKEQEKDPEKRKFLLKKAVADLLAESGVYPEEQ